MTTTFTNGPNSTGIVGTTVPVVGNTDSNVWIDPTYATGGFGYAVTVESIPEPATLLIWSLLAALGIGWGWRRRKG